LFCANFVLEVILFLSSVDFSQIVVVLRVTGGVSGNPASIAPKVGPLGLVCLSEVFVIASRSHSVVSKEGCRRCRQGHQGLGWYQSASEARRAEQTSHD
jgi:hypothetical protein